MLDAPLSTYSSRMNTLVILNARILTLAGRNEPRRGSELADLGVIERGWIRIRDGYIKTVRSGQPSDTDTQGDTVIDARGRLVMPAFIDCHTHACWAGERYGEFEARLAGADYLKILEQGGGIMATVRAVRQASRSELTDALLTRLDRMNSLGTTVAEVKSGYGLTTDDELKMLDAIRAADSCTDMMIQPTFLGAHAVDRDNPDFIEKTINETLPAAAESYPGIACDAYCEQGAWSLDQTRRLFEAAQGHGLPLRVHADQFHSLGATRMAIEMGARSVDHLEATTPVELEMLARSDTFGVALPVSGFQIDDRYAPARALVDAGGLLAIATNYNPGSAPSPSMPFTIALAARKLRLTAAEAITACTWNAACVLGFQHVVGSLEPGKRADLQLLDCTDARELAYEIALPGPLLTFTNGLVTQQRGDYRAGLTIAPEFVPSDHGSNRAT